VLSDLPDLDATLRAVANVAVPLFADFCIVDFTPADDHDHARRVGSRHDDATIDAALREVERRGIPDDDVVTPQSEALRTGRPVLIEHISQEWLDEVSAERGQADMAAIFRTQSVLAIGLVAREQVIGAISFASKRPGRHYSEADLPIARELAARMALAIDNAQLYNAAQRASRLRDEVLGVVSHDLRNPMSAIAMCAKVLAETPPASEEERRSLIEAIREATEWTNRLIQDLLDVSSIEAGRLSVHPEPTAVAPLIASALGMFEEAARGAEIVLVGEAPAGLPAVRCDPDRVVQVLGNLVGNALKFTSRGGRVAIDATANGGDVLFSVADSGRGIPAEHLPHVFDRYWQQRGTARARGVGLGLTIARGIVEAHGGRIWAESTVGQGSTFRFTLPASPGD
jgi:signal transduction histidine kinase